MIKLERAIKMMKILNERPEERLYISVSGRGNDVNLTFDYILFGRYKQDSCRIDFTGEEARDFFKKLEIAMAKVEEKSLLKSEEDDD